MGEPRVWAGGTAAGAVSAAAIPADICSSSMYEQHQEQEYQLRHGTVWSGGSQMQWQPRWRGPGRSGHGRDQAALNLLRAHFTLRGKSELVFVGQSAVVLTSDRKVYGCVIAVRVITLQETLQSIRVALPTK